MQAGGGGKRRRGGSPKKRRAEGTKLLCFVEGDEPLRVEGESASSAVRRYETSLLGLSLEFVPETLVGDGRRQGERKLAHGMRQGDVAGEEADTSAGIASGCAVLEVSLDRATEGGELATDLMMAPRMELDLHEVVAVARSQESVGEAGKLGPWGIGTSGSDIALILLFVAYEVLLQGIGEPRGTRRDDGPVALGDFARAEELVHSAQRLRCLGEDHEPAYGTIESMDDAEIDVAGLLVLLFEPSLEGFAHRLVTGLIALDDLAGTLGDAE